MFLTLNQVHQLHAMGLEDHGGSPGVRDLGMIESALASARNTFEYGGGDDFAVAAASEHLTSCGIEGEGEIKGVKLAMI